jgi:RimJ/RimL family protein N-acetyltransferase
MSVVHEIRPVGPSERVTLSDGSAVRVRPLRGDDEPALRAFLGEVSPESLRRRFCGATDLARAATSLVCDCGPDELALVVEAATSGEIVGHAASFRLGTSRAEVAFLVTDEWQGRGLGSLLLSRLADHAESHGLSTLVADVLPSNRAMLTVFERSGYPVELRFDEHGVEVEIDLTWVASALTRAA